MPNSTRLRGNLLTCDPEWGRVTAPSSFSDICNKECPVRPCFGAHWSCASSPSAHNRTGVSSNPACQGRSDFKDPASKFRCIFTVSTEACTHFTSQLGSKRKVRIGSQKACPRCCLANPTASSESPRLPTSRAALGFECRSSDVRSLESPACRLSMTRVPRMGRHATMASWRCK